MNTPTQEQRIQNGVNRALGLTLIELLLGLLIAGILALAAAPSLGYLLSDARLAGSTNQLIALINTARAEGAYRSAMLVCSQKGRCETFREPDTHLLLLADHNDNRSLDVTDEVIATLSLPEGMTVQWRSFRNKPWLRINRFGVAYYQNGHFLFCYRGLSRKVILNYQARARISKEVSGKNCPQG